MFLRIERMLFGPLPEAVRRPAHIDLIAASCFGVFIAACLSFLPVVLRRLGATTEMLALYIAFNYVGLLISPLGMRVLKRVPTLEFAVVSWTIGRGSLVLALFAQRAEWLLALTCVFWVCESLPAPAYTRIMTSVYPREYRGRAMSGVRIGMALVIVLTTPLAGAMLDRVGSPIVFSIVALFGIAAALLFQSMPYVDAPAPALAADAPRKHSGLWRVLRADRTFALYLGTLVCYGLGGVMGAALYPVVQVNRLGLSYTDIGTLSLVQSVFWLAGYAFWGRVLDKRGAIWVLWVNMGLVAVVTATYIFADSIWTLLPAFIAQGLVQGGFELGATNANIELTRGEQVLEYAVLQNIAIGARGIVAPLIGSALVAAGVADTTVFTLATVLVLISLAMMVPVYAAAGGASRGHVARPASDASG